MCGDKGLRSSFELQHGSSGASRQEHHLQVNARLVCQEGIFILKLKPAQYGGRASRSTPPFVPDLTEIADVGIHRFKEAEAMIASAHLASFRL